MLLCDEHTKKKNFCTQATLQNVSVRVWTDFHGKMVFFLKPYSSRQPPRFGEFTNVMEIRYSTLKLL